MAKNLQAQYDQPFGANRIHTDRFDWRILSGRNVDIYYYPEEEHTARFALIYADRVADSLREKFNLGIIAEKAQIILYAGHIQFNQTNTIAGELPEGVLGFTEFSEMRIALPYLSDFEQFRHTIHHELVHYYHLEKIRRYLANLDPRIERTKRCVATGRSPRSSSVWLRYMPGWWVEGLAEYWSGDQDLDDEMYIRDLVLHGQIPSVEDFSRTGGFAIYPLGGELVRFIGSTYGESRITAMYENANCYNSFQGALAGTLGITLEELSRRFEHHLQARYSGLYREGTNIRSLDITASRLGTGREFNVLPTTYTISTRELQRNLWMRNEDTLSTLATCQRDSLTAVIFISPSDGYPTIYESILGCDERNGVRFVTNRRILRGFDRVDFEKFHVVSHMDVKSDSTERVLTFIAQNTTRDFLYVLDLNTLSIITNIRFDNLVTLSSPVFCGENSIVFVGMNRSGTTDLYEFSRDSGTVRQITNDPYMENDPACDSENKRIVFSSNRTEFGRNGATNLFVLDTETGETRQITHGAWNDDDPEWSLNDSNIVFASNRNNLRNLYEISITSGIVRSLTNYASATYQPNYVNNDSAVVFMAFHRGSYEIYYARVGTPQDSISNVEIVDPNEAGWSFFETPEDSISAFEIPSRIYYPRLHSADATSSVDGAITPWGISGMGNLLANDVLGDHVLALNLAGRLFFKEGLRRYNSMSSSIYYFNQSRRMTWGVGVFTSSGLKLNRYFRNVVNANELGVLGISIYPINRFRRIEATTSLRFSDQRPGFPFLAGELNPYNLLQPDSLNYNRRGLMFENNLSLVYDNTLWLITGPISGYRYRLNLGLTTNLSDRSVENVKASIDYRRYFRIRGITSYSAGVFGYVSAGHLPERIMVGGSTSMRLYSRDLIFGSFYADRGWMINQEIRTPLFDLLYVKTPIFGLAFPYVQGAVFLDAGQFSLQGNRSGDVWGSYGLSARLPVMAPGLMGTIIRVDVGRRFYTGRLPEHQEFINFNQTRVALWFGLNF